MPGPEARLSRLWWLPLALFLLLAIAAGGAVLVANLRGGQPLEILTPSPTPTIAQEIYIGGVVAAPGIYPLREGDSIQDLLKAAGGITDQADPGQLKLVVPSRGKAASPQLINVNTAEAWLLEALPGIGQRLAQAIVDYRTQNGLFRTTGDIMKVPGISTKTYEGIKDQIAVGD